MNTLVLIGANGFIGSYIQSYYPLVKNFKVIPLVRGSLDLMNPFEVYNFMKGTKPYAVINAYSAGGKERYKEQALDIMCDNLIMFDNIRRCRHLFKKYINIGSGAEYDFQLSPEPREDHIFTSVPNTSYGASKNIISRLCQYEENFYTLRLFGCFGVGEPSFRLFSKFLSGTDTFEVDDKYFDNISIDDFLSILYSFVVSDPPHKDVNCVYSTKSLVSEQLEILSSVTGHKRPIKINEVMGTNYIGKSTSLYSLGVSLEGLKKGIEKHYV